MAEAASQPPNRIYRFNWFSGTPTICVDINGMEVIAEVDPCSFYTILNACPADLRLGEAIKISLDNGQTKVSALVVEDPIHIDRKATSGQILYVGTSSKIVIGWKQLHDLDWMKEYTNRRYLTDIPPVVIRGADDPKNARLAHLLGYLLPEAISLMGYWIRNRYIDKSDSVCNSRLTLDRRLNGNIDFIFHYGNLNSYADKDPPHPRENLTNTVESITLGKYYSVVKLYYPEWQIPLDTYTKYKTAFVFLGKKYAWNRLPTEYRNKDTKLCEALEKILDKLPHNMSKRVTFYLDTVLISADTKEECDIFTEKLLQHMEDHRIRVRHTHRQMSRPKVYLMDREVNEDGVTLGNDYISKVKNTLTSPESVSQLRSILRVLNQAREFTPGFELLSESLEELARERELYWDDDDEETLNRLKALVAVQRFLVPSLAENETCTVQIFIMQKCWMAQILNRAGKPYRFRSGEIPSIRRTESFTTKELKAMTGVWQTHRNVLKDRDVEWEVESPDIERFKNNIYKIARNKLRLDFLKSERCKIKVVQAEGRQPPIPWSEVR